MPATLIVLSGLPGVGKTTIARKLAEEVGAVHIRIDTIEQAIRRCGTQLSGPEGYCVGYVLAADHLGLGFSVVADSVNPLPITREGWRHAAKGHQLVEIEIVCSDLAIHRDRVESRAADIEGHILPTWQEVVEREYEPWDRPILRLDTAILTTDLAVDQILRRLGLRH